MKLLALRYLVALAAGSLACSERDRERPPDLALVPRASAAAEVRGDTQPRGTAGGMPCVRQAPARHAVRGVLRREVRLGPPGYGETPDRDERDTIVVLALPAALAVCPDSAQGPAGRPAIRAERMQLVAPPRDALLRLGDSVTVYGRLLERALGAHYTPVVVAVDSIPALRRPAAARTATRPAAPRSRRQSGAG